MHDFGALPGTYRNRDVQIFRANGTSGGGKNYTAWNRPRGCTMGHFLIIGAGGRGGNSVAGAASTAAGGGGGGSGSQVSGIVPLHLLPDRLYICVSMGATQQTTATATNISVDTPSAASPSSILLQAGGGSNGGAAVGATAGAAGAAGSANITNNYLAGHGIWVVISGQAGIIGGTTVAGGAQSVPTNGLLVGGGTGGGGLPALSTAGSAGGAWTGANLWAARAGGTGGTTAPTAGGDGVHGGFVLSPLMLSWPGTGGGSSGMSASAGVAGGNGGKGGIGCGGGGGGGSFTGFGPALGGDGGDGIVIITCW